MTEIRLKPARARAYGLEPGQVYRVVREYQRPGYKAVWYELDGGLQVKASETRSF